MNKLNLDGNDFLSMIVIAAQRLNENKATINGLNVFPVPDGDTGTNMHLTLESGIMELRAKSSAHLGLSAEALSRGLLMGARGNSGVILSQLFRGFARSLKGLEQANASQLSTALQQGVECAYQAVVKPVEGTILTVSKQAAKHSAEAVNKTDDIIQLFRGVQYSAEKALAQTPEQLPILKQVGVVDAGGQGLVHIYEGFVQALTGEVEMNPIEQTIPSDHVESRIAQLHLNSDEIEFGYCTEFIIKLNPEALDQFNETTLREDLNKLGNSLVVVSDDDLVKVHIHAEQPGSVMNHAMLFGDLTRIKIENMREQHAHIIQEKNDTTQHKSAGILAVAMGEGISRTFQSLGVDIVLEGGQSMNPSTQDILLGINRVPADVIYVLPNNSNIILAAEQAGQLADKEVIIIPSKTIPQGLAAVITFNENADSSENENNMKSALEQVRSGSVTFATRNSKIDDMDIQENDFLGMVNNRLVIADPNPVQTIFKLVDQLLNQDGEVMTIFCGEDAKPDWTESLQQYIEDQYPEVELEIVEGGQPLYYYIISVE